MITLAMLRECQRIALLTASGHVAPSHEWKHLADQLDAQIARERRLKRGRRDNLVGMAELAIHMAVECDDAGCLKSGLEECDRVIKAYGPKGLVQ